MTRKGQNDEAKMRMNRLWAIGAILLFSWDGLSMAAIPPERINLQGVLRDNAGAPVDGSQPMRFHLYGSDVSCPSGGTLLLSDDHGSVTVSGGLFNVALGAGTVTPGMASSLGEAFRDNSEVWVEIEVGGETLCPPVQPTEYYSFAALASEKADVSGGDILCH